MTASATLQTDVIIVGAGLAGLVTALELLGSGRRVLLIDRDSRENLGGLAGQSAGGVLLIDSPHQRRRGIKDSPELAWSDWQRVADYDAIDWWPRQWGEFFCRNSREYVLDFLDARKLRFLPLPLWAERGGQRTGNTVPRWHMTWGLGPELIARVLQGIELHPQRANLQMLFDTEISAFEMTNGSVSGVHGRQNDGTRELHVAAPLVVIASGGMCGGNLDKVRANWYAPWGRAPEKLLNGGHTYGDGLLHEQVATLGGAVTHLDLQWHYPSGVHNPAKRRPNDGLSLIPPRSALWLNARGERIMTPGPLLGNGDTRQLVASVLSQPGQYSWQVMNWKIAVRELTVSGTGYLTAVRDKNWPGMVSTLLFGNTRDIGRLLRDCPDDIVTADSLAELMAGMDSRNLYGLRLDRARMEETIRSWDAVIERGPAFHNDEQLRWIANMRNFRGDRMRTCNFQKILDRKAGPLIAIREFVTTRKSLGGIQTDLQCRVLRSADGEAISGLYAVGEAAGYGGGGIHGKGSLEGSFLAGCILTARVAARAIAGVLPHSDAGSRPTEHGGLGNPHKSSYSRTKPLSPS